MPNSGFSEANWEREFMDIGQMVDVALQSQPGDKAVKEKLREAILEQSVRSIDSYLHSHLSRGLGSHERDEPGSTTDDDCIPVVDIYYTTYHGFYTSDRDIVGLDVTLNYGTPFYYGGNRHPTVEFSRLARVSEPPLGLVRQARMELEPIVQKVIEEKCGPFLQGLLSERQAEIARWSFIGPDW